MAPPVTEYGLTVIHLVHRHFAKHASVRTCYVSMSYPQNFLNEFMETMVLHIVYTRKNRLQGFSRNGTDESGSKTHNLCWTG